MAHQRTRRVGADDLRAAKDRLILAGRDIDRGIAIRFASSKWWWLCAAGVSGVLLSVVVKPRPRRRRR